MAHAACDIHTHTVFSRHAYSTVEENVRAAVELRCELLGITDHFSSMVHPEAPTGVDLRDYQHFLNFEVWPESWLGVRLMHGCEADIVDLDGHLYGWDMPVDRGLGGPYDGSVLLQDVVFSNCDYVIASVHMKQWAGELGKLIEINEGSLYGRQDCTERCRYIAERCMVAGCMVATSSDAHISCEVARLDGVRRLLDEVGYPPRLIATRDAETFLRVWERALAR